MAVKIVPLEDDTGDVQREIEHLRDCNCPNIVEFFGWHVYNEKLWIIMEYCEGSSLLDVMAATSRCLTETQVSAALAGCAGFPDCFASFTYEITREITRPGTLTLSAVSAHHVPTGSVAGPRKADPYLKFCLLEVGDFESEARLPTKPIALFSTLFRPKHESRTSCVGRFQIKRNPHASVGIGKT